MEKRSGFDSSVTAREEDHLNRWPFAKEIFSVATTGPQEWSVRIGVYGEWGTGKTSVLNFVDTMGRMDGHIVVRFNPWEYSTKVDLWHAFVQSIIAELPQEAKTAPRTWRSKIKRPAAPIANWISDHSEGMAGAVDNQKVTLALYSINLLKSFFFSNKKDLECILTGLGGKRLFVLVDDLDRTNGDLVPEMLYAIKEIMDIGGFAFVCAFDPLVVGQVLGDFHKGHADGLKFLEKIIDYPRWLPDPTRGALMSLARHDIAKYCPYVPVQAMEQTIDLLPRNPRVLRQFLRLLELLKPQISRHYEHELVWPVILAANVLKVRHPRLAPFVLDAPRLWSDIHSRSWMGEKNDGDSIEQLIQGHITNAIAEAGLSIGKKDQKEIESCVVNLAGRIDAWGGLDEQGLKYQVYIAEAPHAVTWKEFDAFVAKWDVEKSTSAVDGWIHEHAAFIGQNYQEVYLGLFDKTVQARQSELAKSSEAMDVDGMIPMLRGADMLMGLLECLTFELGQLDKPEKLIGILQYDQAYKAVAQYIGWTQMPEYRAIREKEKSYIIRLTEEWAHDITPVIRILRPFMGLEDISGDDAKLNELHKLLCKIALPKYSRQLLDRFREQGFIASVFSASDGNYEIKCLLQDEAGALWGGLRSDALDMLASAKKNQNVQQNSYHLLRRFEYILRTQAGSEEARHAECWLKDEQLGKALWESVTSHPLNPRVVAFLRGLLVRISNWGVSFEIPEWWKRTIEQLDLAGANSDLHHDEK